MGDTTSYFCVRCKIPLERKERVLVYVGGHRRNHCGKCAPKTEAIAKETKQAFAFRFSQVIFQQEEHLKSIREE